MFDWGFEGLFEEDILSKEHLKVLNCEFKNCFIRGWNKEETIDVICRKIKGFFELENFIYPKEILVALKDDEDRLFFRQKLSETLEEKEILEQINFQLFQEFFDTYAPEVSKGKRIYKQISLKRNCRVVFIIDPPENYIKSKNFIPILSKLFPEEGAKMFLCEYERYADDLLILNGFPEAEIIKLEGKDSSFGEQKPRIKKSIEIKKTKETPKKRNDRFGEVVAALGNLQMEGESFYDFYIEINTQERDLDVEESFEEIFKNEFRVYLLWLEINRKNVKGEKITNDLLMDVNRLTFYNHANQREIEMGKRKYMEEFERIFIDLGVREELNRNHPGKWMILQEIVRNLSFPENINNMRRIIDSRTVYFSELINQDLFIRNSRVVEPKLTSSPGYTPHEKRWKLQNRSKKIKEENHKPPEAPVPDVSNEELLSEMVGEIRESQNRGGTLNNHRIHIGTKEDEEIIKKCFFQIFRNEFEIFMNLIGAMRHIAHRTTIPEALMEKILKWPHYSDGSIMKIIGKKIIYTGRIEELFEDLGVADRFKKWNPEVWAIFLKITEDLTFEKDMDSLPNILNSRIYNEAKLLKNEIFVKSENQVKPRLISGSGIGSRLVYSNPKDQEKLIEILNSWETKELGESIDLKIDEPEEEKPMEPSGEEQFEKIIEEIKKFQEEGWSLNNYQILIGPHEEEKMIRKYFSKIFHNEFDIFTSWIRVIKQNFQNIPIPEKLIEKLKKWPGLNQECFEKIVNKKHIYVGSLQEIFIDLGIKDRFLKVNPDIWTIFLKITADLSLGRDLENITSTINSRVFNESKLIKNELFEKVEGRVVPERIFVPKRRTITYIDPKDQELFSSLLRSQIPEKQERTNPPIKKTESQIIMEKIKMALSQKWSFGRFLVNFSSHFGGEINPSSFHPELIKNFSEIINQLKWSQDKGQYYRKYGIVVNYNENPILLRTLHFRIFLNEFTVFMKVINIAQLNSAKKQVPQNLITGLSLWNYGDKIHEKEIISPKTGNLNNINNIIDKFGFKKPQITCLLKDIISQFDVFDPNLIDNIYIKIFHKFEEMDDGIFIRDVGAIKPRIIEKNIAISKPQKGFFRRMWEKIWAS